MNVSNFESQQGERIESHSSDLNRKWLQSLDGRRLTTVAHAVRAADQLECRTIQDERVAVGRLRHPHHTCRLVATRRNSRRFVETLQVAMQQSLIETLRLLARQQQRHQKVCGKRHYEWVWMRWMFSAYRCTHSRLQSGAFRSSRHVPSNIANPIPR